MNTWLALLRGVNVNGITIKMADVRGCFADAGLGDPRTVLASGNVIFTAENGSGARTRAGLKSTIEKALRDRFGYDAWIVLVDVAEVAAIVANFPFDAADPAIQPYVLFSSDQSALDALFAAAPDLDPAVEAIAPGAGVIYWRCPKGRSTDTPFAKLAANNKFRTTTTNRNLRTLEKVLAAA